MRLAINVLLWINLSCFCDSISQESMRRSFNLLEGRHKWLGGVKVGHDIYAVPSHSKYVLRLTPATGEFKPLKSKEFKGRFKWLRGQQEGDAVYCIPAHANTVLKVVPSTGEVSEIDLPAKVETNGPWKWHGSARGGDGNIYTIPSNAEHVLKISPSNDAIEVVKGGPFQGKNKWYGGIASPPTGCVYGVPYASEGVLKIDPIGGEDGKGLASVFGSFPRNGEATHQWHGGIFTPVDNNIYCFPSHGTSVLKIDTAADEATQMKEVFLGRYKWLGGCLDDEGNIFGVPSDATSILKVDVKHGICTTFGKVSDQKNKWQGAVKGANGKLYCLPANAQQVLVIDPVTCTIDLIGDLPPTKNKFQGGFLSQHDNCIYAIPECCDRILKIDVDSNTCSLLDLSITH